MASPADRPGARSRCPPPCGAAIAGIAAAAGAWCPALSPDGDRVAYVTDRSGIPRLEVAALDGGRRPRSCPRPDEEVVSVAWSPGRRLAGLPGEPRRLDLRRAARRAARRQRRTALVAGADPRATVFAGGWTGPGSYVCSIAPGDGPDADVVLVDVATGEQPHPGPRRLPVRHRACRPTSGSCWPAGARAATGTSSSSTSRPACSAALLRPRRPRRASPPRTAASRADGRSVLRPRLAARRARSPTAPGWCRSRCPTTACRARAAVVLSRPDADLDGYAAARRRHRARRLERRRRHRAAGCTPCPTAPCVRRIPLPEPVHARLVAVAPTARRWSPS